LVQARAQKCAARLEQWLKTGRGGNAVPRKNGRPSRLAAYAGMWRTLNRNNTSRSILAGTPDLSNRMLSCASSLPQPCPAAQGRE